MRHRAARAASARRWALVGVAWLLGACVDGYPAEDNPRTAALTVKDHVRALNGQLRAQVGAPPASFELASPCVLVLHQGARREAIGLRAIEVDLRADKATGRYAVTLAVGAAPASPVESFDVEGWIEAVAFRSHLRQLQISCIDEAGGQR